MNESRRTLLGGAAAGALLTACSGLPLGPRSIEVPYDHLFEEIAERFPFDRRLAQLFDVTLAAPRFRPMPEENRMATELDVHLGSGLMNVPLQGSLSLSYGLRYEPTDYSVRLTRVRVERFQLDAVPEALQDRFSKIGALLAEEVLEDWTVHRLTAEQVKAAADHHLRPGTINVAARGLVVTLEALGP